MECAEGQHIAVGQLKYGTKTDQRCLFGVSDCDTEAARVCCWYDPMDKMTDFSEQNRYTQNICCITIYYVQHL